MLQPIASTLVLILSRAATFPPCQPRDNLQLKLYSGYAARERVIDFGVIAVAYRTHS